MDWRDRANCIGTDTDAFFPEKGDSYKLIRRICEACEVRAECLDWAVRHEASGWWAGTHPDQRKELRTKLGIVFRAPEVEILGRAG